MPARNIQIMTAVAVIAIVAVVVIAITQLSGDSGADPTPVGQQTATVTVTAVGSPSGSASPTVPAGTATTVPTSTPSPTPSPSPTPTPTAPDSTVFAIFQLADELGASPSDFTVLSYDEGSWPSAAYGCPAPGMFYAQGEMDGWSFQIGYQDQVFEFHAGKNDVQGDTLVNCTKNEDLLEGTINPVELAGLDSTTKIEVRRINSEGGYTLKSTVTDPEDIQEIINVLNVPVALSPAVSCTPTVEMAFTTDDGEQVLHAICSGQTRLLRGDQGFWNGMDATVPIQFQSVIGPYLATDDLPPPPTPLPGSPTVTAGQ